jgi:MFS family permease
MTQRQNLTMIVLLGTQFMLAADFSILNVAAPRIGSSLHFPLGELQWIVTAFALASSGFTLVFGWAGDLLGRRRMFISGIALMAVASLVGAWRRIPPSCSQPGSGRGWPPRSPRRLRSPCS